MRFPVDARLPPVLAGRIERRGQTAEYVADLEMTDTSDREIWQQARRTGAVILSKDPEFVTHATLDEDGPPVVWIRLGNTRRQALLEWFSPPSPKILAALEHGEKPIEIE
jgi:predicted nuclease of predicted toxin-antitoxin system